MAVRIHRLPIVILVAVLACVLAGCQREAGPPGEARSRNLRHERQIAEKSLEYRFEGEGPIVVECTTGMVADLVRNVGGEHVRVSQMMGEGVDPHLYNPTPSDVTRLGEADMIVFSGLHLEGKLTEHLESLADDKPVVPVTLRIETDRLIEADAGYYDPHLWFDVALWSEAAGTVADVLGECDPAHADEYESNAQSYRERLTELHAWCAEEIGRIPEEQRVLVTAHDAFHYFGRAYNVEVEAIQGVSTTSEAGLRRINELVDFMVTNKIRAVFVESSVPEKNVQSLIEGCAARGHEVVKGGELFSDAMGPQGTPEGTYEGMIRHNVETIRDALK